MLARLLETWRDPSPTAGRVFLLLAAAFFSLGGFFIKEVDADAISIVFFRCLFSALIVLPFIRGRRFPGRADSVVSIALFVLLLVTYVGSTKETTAANAIFLQYTAPVFVVIVGAFILSEKLRFHDAIAICICITGIAVLFLGNSGSGDTKGLILGATSGAFYGTFIVWLRRIRYADAIAITFLNCAGVVVVLVLIPGVLDVGAKDIALLVLMATVQFALPYVLFTRGISVVRGAEASLIALTEPLLNPIWVALFYGENPSTATIIGGAIILVGLSVRYAVFRERAEVVEGGFADVAVVEGGESGGATL